MRFRVKAIEHYGAFFVHTVGFISGQGAQQGIVYDGTIVLGYSLNFTQLYAVTVLMEPDHDPDETAQLP